MPTFFNPGGCTFAGGDMMPLVILWPKAGNDMKIATNTAARICFELSMRAAGTVPTYLCLPSFTHTVLRSSESGICTRDPHAGIDEAFIRLKVSVAARDLPHTLQLTVGLRLFRGVQQGSK